jgi:hypothetical protein
VNEPVASRPRKNRRKGPDWVVQSFHWLSVIGWVLLIVALGLSHMAKPEMNTGLVRYWGIQIRDYWEPTLTGQLIYLLWWCCLVSLCSIVLNQFRLRRATDRQHYNSVALLLIALAALSFFYQV